MQDVMQKNESNRLAYMSKEEITSSLNSLNEVGEVKQTLMPTIEANKRLKEVRARRRKKRNKDNNIKKEKVSEKMDIGETIDIKG